MLVQLQQEAITSVCPDNVNDFVVSSPENEVFKVR